MISFDKFETNQNRETEQMMTKIILGKNEDSKTK